jgi:DNA primase
MSMIPDDKVREVRERAAILEVISDYMSLRKSGANYQGLCPFHGEKTPSFSVNPGKGIFHCFGCGVGGNVVTFVMKMEGLSFPEAVKFLAKRVGVLIEERPLSAAEKRLVDERDQLYSINDQAARFYRRVLVGEAAGETGRRYLESRGVDAATAEAYRLGFAPDKWDGLARHFEQQKISLELAEKLGLLRRRDGGGYYDTFRNRLLFTIADLHGRPIGFGGRVLDNTLPKYINSPESPIYHKSSVLFGIDLAKQAMREQGTALVVEGYFDHLALYQAGIRNAVATCGTALTSSHVKVLQRYAGKVYTLFDGDSAGRKATLKSMELFLDEGFPANVIELPAGDDPDSFLKNEGATAFGERIANARPIFDFFFRDLLGQMDSGTIEGKVRIVEELAPRLAKIANPLERELYEKEISRTLGIEPAQLRRRTGRGPSVVPTPVPAARREAKKGASGTEEMLLALMAKYPHVAGKVMDHGAAKLFTDDLLPVAESIIANLQAGKVLDLPQLLEQIESDEERSRLAALFVADGHLEEIDEQKAFEQCRQSLERHSVKDVKALARELARLEPDSPRYLELLHEIDLLRNKKSRLL